MPKRPTLAALCPVLALAACAPSDSGEGKDAPSLPPGFELAAAKQATPPVAKQGAKIVDLSVEQVMDAIAKGDVRIIDVRTDEEVAEGMIPGAEHVPLDRFDPAKLGLNDGREVILYCRSGRRSASAATKLAEHTGKPAQHLAGGILAWKEAARPIE